jgi:purine-binding chemotaxis protein CheW
MKRQFCAFFLDHFLFGVEVSEVQEVVSNQMMTRVPLAPPVIGGVINLRGQLVTAIDVRCLLDMPPLPEGHLPMNVVLHTSDGLVSLLVDDIDNVIEVDESTFEEPPGTVHGRARELIRGVYKLEDRLLLVLSTEAVLDRDKRKNSSAPR